MACVATSATRTCSPIDGDCGGGMPSNIDIINNGGVPGIISGGGPGIINGGPGIISGSVAQP